MRRRHKAWLLLAALWLGMGVARAETPRPEPKRASPQEEKRRKLLEEIGLDKKDAPPPEPASSTPNPSQQNQPQEPAPAASGGRAPRTSPATGADRASGPPSPSFRRSIHPLLTSACGSCHRSGGPAAATRFTLPGEAAADHLVVVRLVAVRDPATSALLTKVSGQPHAGGSPWPIGSEPYARILAWIARGAHLDGVPTVETPVAAAPPPRKIAPPASAAAVAEATPSLAAVPQNDFAPQHNDFAGTVHPILMTSCAACHRSSGAAAMTRLVLSGDAVADEAQVLSVVDPATPERSLLVAKAGGEMHGGGAVLPVGDPRYRALLAWAARPVSTPPAPPTATSPQPASAPPTTKPVSAAPAPPRHGDGPHGGIDLPLGFLLNGRFDLAYERRQFSGHAFGSEGVNALRSYHHFLFLSHERSDDPCGISVEIVTLQFWAAHCRVIRRSHPVALLVSGGKILVPFGADPLYHQSYGGLAGFDQRILPVIWAEEGIAAHLVHQRGDFVVTDDFFAVRGYALARADGVLNLQNDLSPVDDAKIGWGNRVGAAWRGLSAWYSAYFNPLGFGRHLVMQAIDVTVWRQRAVPVLGHFSFGAGLLRADVAGSDAAGAGGVGKDYYHLGSYLQFRYHPTDWLFLQYRQGLRTFNNRRGLILDNSRLTSADGSTHNFGVVGRYRGLTAGVFYFVNLEKVDEIPDDLFRVSIAYDF